MEHKFVVISSTEGLELVTKYRGKFLSQSEHDYSTQYLLNNNQVVLFPAISDKGLWFEHASDVGEVLKAYGRIPIDEPLNPFIKLAHEIKMLPDNLTYFIDAFFQFLGMESIDKNFDRNELLEISKKLSKLLKKKDLGHFKTIGELYIVVGIFIGEQTRKKIGGDWVLMKRYGINPYYEPEIEFNERKSQIWYSFGEGFQKKKLDLRYCINRSCLLFKITPFPGIRLPFIEDETRVGDQPDL